MALVTLEKILKDAEDKGYAVPSFNGYNLETVQAILETAEEMRAPVILQVYSRLFTNQLGYYIGILVQGIAREMSVPIALHLDHGKDEKEIIKAIRYGYTGVMIDGSARTLAENIELTRHAVKAASIAGVSVEGELGRVGTTQELICGNTFTDPTESEEFAKATGVDALAVMVGTAHGIYKKEPELDIPRLRKIKEKTGLPLVLHGGSGVPDEQIRAAIDAGVRKINFATDINRSFFDPMRRIAKDDLWDQAIDRFMIEPLNSVAAFVREKILLLGAAQRT